MISQLKALFLYIWQLLGLVPGIPAPKRQKDLPDDVPTFGEPAVLKRARQDVGQEEVKGPDANPVIMSYWRHVDYKPPDGDETAWCSAALCAWHEEIGIPGTRQPNARSWERWGQALKNPKPGCVAVEWRGSPDSWTGHCCIYIGPGKKPGTYMAIGGNQANKVCVQERSLAKVLAFREPLKNGNSRTLKAGALGVVSAGMGGAVILDSATEIMGIIGVLKSLGTSAPSMVLATSVLSILCFATMIYARWDNFKTKNK
ncbi:MAG TPA: TIGR02594 family protein [Advenella sp.]|nr:TIGR02594 family protein [Advenella sp.]